MITRFLPLTLVCLAAASLPACSDDDSNMTASGTTSAAGPGSSGSGGSGAGTTGSGGGGGAGGNGGAGGSAPVGVPFVYVGVDTDEILIYRLDRETGALTFLDRTDAGPGPSFLAVDPTRRFLYAVNEGSSEIASFAIDPATGGLTFLNRVPSGGQGPAHVSVDGTGGYVLAANYGGGSVSVFAVQGDGSLGDALDTYPTGQNAHFVHTDPGNRFAFVPNKGSDTVSQLVFDEATGALSPNPVPSVATADGAGPRHLAFHPAGGFAYVINEIDDTMTAYEFDADLGTLSPLLTLPTLPPGADGPSNSCADVHPTPDGAFLYGSNRGHDSLVIYALDPVTGMHSLVGHQSTGGSTPRNFTVDPTGELVLVANLGSDNVVSFRVNPATGMLTELITTDLDGSPSFVGIVLLPGE